MHQSRVGFRQRLNKDVRSTFAKLRTGGETKKKKKKSLVITHMFTWKPIVFIRHIQPRSHDDRFPMPLWETWFCSSLDVPIRLVVLMENPGQCPFRQFNFDPYGDHIQTSQCQSVSLPTHEWINSKVSLLLRSVGHRIKTHKITPVLDNERGDIEIKDYFILTHG